MTIDGIHSIRDYRGAAFTDIVYEWEEELGRLLAVPVLQWGRKHLISCHVNRRLPWMRGVVERVLFGKGKHYLRFVMNALDDTPLFNCRSCIPILIDFFVTEKSLPTLISIYSRCEYVFVTSRQAYDWLRGHELPFKVVHFPLTLSERHFFEPGVRYVKKYDFALIGGQNDDETLKGYVSRYKREHPDFHYIVRNENSYLEYLTDEGAFVADASDREGYLKLMRETKVVVYSTPGIRGRKDANGYDQVTPKLLEYLACQCQVIPRYRENSDTRFFELERIGRSVECYEDFCGMLTGYLASEPDLAQYRAYLDRHSTASLIPLLKK